MGYAWREEKRQKTWLWVGLLFLVFYFMEAVLFWGPEPRVSAPWFTPLVFWGSFGAALIWVVTRPTSDARTSTRLDKLQSGLLGITITAMVVGSAFLIIRRTGDVTLGHVVLLWSLGQAALVLGATSFNVGWILAALCWIGGGAYVLCQPSGQDYVIGAAVAIGFMLIGVCRKRLDLERSEKKTASEVLDPAGLPGR